MKKIFKINGVLIKEFSKEKVEIIGIFEENEVKQNKTTYIGNCFNPDPFITNGTFSLAPIRVFIEKVTDATKEEEDNLNKEMDAHNMCIGEYTYEHIYYCFPNTEKRTKTAIGLIHKRKEDVHILINGERVPLCEAEKRLHGKYVLIQGDNGYSHWWSEGVSGDAVSKMLSKWFDSSLGDNKTTYGGPHSGRVYVGNHYGYTFNKVGELNLRVFDEPIKRESTVSFS